MLDLSSGGMKIRVKDLNVKKGLIIKVLLPFPKIKVALPLLTEVRWVMEKAGIYYVGLSFII